MMKAMPAASTLLRTLGFAAASSIAISNMIGQGVFLKARAMTCNVGSPALMLGAWFIAGLLSLCGALTLAELGAAIPSSGGLYAFLRRAYGGAAGFAFGWMVLFIGSPASVAALGVGAAIFLNLVCGHALDALRFATVIGSVHLEVSGVQVAAIALIVVLVAINCAPAVVNGEIATGFAALKIGMLVALAFSAFALGHGESAHFSASGAAGICTGIGNASRGGVPGFAAALIGALYAYNGWHSLTLVGGEVKEPGRTLAPALILSVLLVIVLYVGANAAYVYILSPLAIANVPPTSSVGVAVVETLFGPAGRTIAAGLLFASAAATLHVTLLTNARVTYAFANDSFAFGLFARVSRRGHVPVNAVVLNGVLAILLVLAGSFDTLSNYFTFNYWVFFVAVGVAVMVLRRREPALPRPYRTIGYPVVPIIYVVVGAWLVVQTAVSSPQSSLIGLAIVAASFPVYVWSKRRAAQVL